MTDGTSAAFSLCEACRTGDVVKALEATTRYGPTSGRGAGAEDDHESPPSTIDATDGEGRTALHWAIAHKQPALAAALMKEHGASAATVDESGTTPLMTACAVQVPLELLELLLSCAPPPTPLTPRTAAAIRERNVAPSEFCGVRDAPSATAGDTAAAPAEDRAPGAAASGSGVVPPLALAWVNRQDENGNTALLLAASRGYRQAMRLLLAAGADPFVMNVRGQTCLHRVVGRGDIPLVEELVSHVRKHHMKHTKRFVNAQDRNGDTALHYAAMENNRELGEALLRNGADRDVKNRQGKEFWQL